MHQNSPDLSKRKKHQIPEPLPMIVDNIQADSNLIQRKVLESSPADPIPEAVCSIFRSNVVKLAKWEGGMQNLERISASLHKFTSIPHFGTELGYEPVSNIQNNFKAKMFSMGVGASLVPTFSPQTQYSTYGSPCFGNVLFQKTFNVHKVLMDKGSEINACSFDIARDVAAAGKGAYDLSVLLFMTHAGGGRNEMYGLFRDCEFLLEGKMESRQKCWICPRGKPTPFAVLFGMPFIASMRATSSWDSRGNMWTKLTAQDGSFSAQYQTVNYNNARNVVELQKRQVEDVADLNVLPWLPITAIGLKLKISTTGPGSSQSTSATPPSGPGTKTQPVMPFQRCINSVLAPSDIIKVLSGHAAFLARGIRCDYVELLSCKLLAEGNIRKDKILAMVKQETGLVNFPDKKESGHVSSSLPSVAGRTWISGYQWITKPRADGSVNPKSLKYLWKTIHRHVFYPNISKLAPNTCTDLQENVEKNTRNQESTTNG
ncbi:hypothetical protein BDR26DRAFT_955324 [Obelidium mucronatum]|nr:hypothetical protein BDR26DRAFT_955324 [Obelidium mucronatum]